MDADAGERRLREWRAAALPWHRLLAPLPDGVVPRRRPVATPEVLASPHGAAIARWDQVTVELSAGAAGLRHVLIVLDASGRPISASDSVLYRAELPRPGDGGEPASASEGEAEICHESLGGRLEEDGTFRGTRWCSFGVEVAGEDEARWEPMSFQPSAAEVDGLKALVAEVMRLGAPTDPPVAGHEG
jgi:hypothetical protein